MEFSAFLIFAVWTSSMIYLTFGKERERAMVFPDYYFFAERYLVNHTIEKKRVHNLDDCELMCYLNDDCVSLNFKKDPEDEEPLHICELNNATHLEYDSDLTTDATFYYRGSRNACDNSPHCKYNGTCQSGFTLKGYRCLCPPGFEGEYCEKDVDECREVRVDKIKQCHPNASCINTQGSYNCSCDSNYLGDGFNCEADPCTNYKELNDSNRKSSYKTPEFGPVLCDDKLPEGWYRFVGAAGTKMATTRVTRHYCGTAFPGWLEGAHPSLEEGKASRMVSFSDNKNLFIDVKNCGSFYIYNILTPPGCDRRYCGSD